ncbi:hypothetical protein [Compostibacillus humi]
MSRLLGVSRSYYTHIEKVISTP